MVEFIIVTFAIGGICLAYMSGVYYFTRVPHVATPHSYYDIIFGYIQKKQPIFSHLTFYDLGSGWGRVLFEAERRGMGNVYGFELSPIHVWVSRLRTLLKRSAIHIQRQNFFTSDFAKADVIYIFLTTNVIAQVEEKLQKEAKPGTIVITLSDKLAHYTPDEVVQSPKNASIQIFCYTL